MLKPLSVQLYSLRARAEKDFVAVHKDVAAMGYKGVEPAGFWNIRLIPLFLNLPLTAATSMCPPP